MTHADTAAAPVVAGAFARALPRLLPPVGEPPDDLGRHLRRHGTPPYRGAPRRLIAAAATAGLTGRGGAAFPTARKMAAVADAGRLPVAVGNGAEGDPASDKDKLLLWRSAHLVLDGLQLAAEAVGARQSYLYVRRHSQLRERLLRALAERSARRLDRVPVELVEAPPRFLAGEESALVAHVAGGPALPRFTPQRVFVRGVAGAPTLVQNVETLAHIALIARHGADWFRALGTPHEPGSMLTTCYRTDGTAMVVESALGTPLRHLLRAGEQDMRPAQAVLVGGYHGCWVTATRAADLTLANEALRQVGAFMGTGVLAALPYDRCGLVETARVVRYLALESAGQCGPCLNGLPRIATALAKLAAPRPDARVRRDIERWAGLVDGRGACHHPDGTVRFVRSALVAFGQEIAQHRRGRCTATTDEPFLPVPAGGPAHADDWR